MLLLGHENGEMYLIKTDQEDSEITLTPSLLLLPSYDGSAGGLIEATIAKMPFSIISVKSIF